jgi:hypothetical protein
MGPARLPPMLRSFVGDCFQPDWNREACNGFAIVEPADDELDSPCGFFGNEQDTRH